MKTRSYFIFIYLMISNVLFSEIKIIPVIKTNLFWGQYFFENESGSFGGNINLFVSPTVNFSENIVVVPIMILDYSTTKDVRELVGGEILTQECLNFCPLNIKFVYKIKPTLKLKLKSGYKIEYLKETKDEQWQKGLFDYNKFTTGFEVEKNFSKKTSVRFGVDVYTIRYPNYQTLASKSEYKVSIDTTTYSEISTNAGKNILDYDTLDVFFESSWSLADNVFSKSLYSISLKNFVDQHIVKEDGSFSNDLRKDILNFLGLSLYLNFEKVKISFNDFIKIYSSNQNSYDVSYTKFIPNSYNYFENEFSPSVSFYLGEAPYIKLNFYFDISYRLYLNRLAQASSGDYTEQKMWQTTNVLGTSFSYPLNDLLKGLSVKMSTNYNFVSSNMKYEKFYKYNYTAFNYYLGLEWEF